MDQCIGSDYMNSLDQNEQVQPSQYVQSDAEAPRDNPGSAFCSSSKRWKAQTHWRNSTKFPLFQGMVHRETPGFWYHQLGVRCQFWQAKSEVFQYFPLCLWTIGSWCPLNISNELIFKSVSYCKDLETEHWFRTVYCRNVSTNKMVQLKGLVKWYNSKV